MLVPTQAIDGIGEFNVVNFSSSRCT